MNIKQLVGEHAATYVKEGMIVGLGTGSTAYYFIEAVGKMVQQGLNVTCVATSLASKKQAEEWGMLVKSIDEVEAIDLLVDGADEVAFDFSGIKGGGGALLFEKVVAERAKKSIWIVDETKDVKQLGAFPLPVEVTPYGSDHVFSDFEKAGYQPSFRMNQDTRYITDGGHYIIDLRVFPIEDPVSFGRELKMKTGVVEHGLFTGLTDIVLIGKANGEIEIRTEGRGAQR